MARCPRCFHRLRTTQLVHEIQSGCGREAPGSVVRVRRTDQRGYVPPSRSHRVPRDEYLASVRVTAEHKRAVQRAKQARHRARKKAAA